MHAAVLTEVNKDLDVRDDVALDDIGPRDLRVKIVSSGVCHSDLSAQNGTVPMPPPMVLGHEGAGIVQDVGSDVDDLAPGDHVILSFVPACRKCRSCLRGESYLCRGTRQAPHFLVDGEPVAGLTGLGTFAEELIVGEDAAVKIDDDVPLEIVSLIGCGVTTGVGAAMNTAGVEPGSSVVVIGCGGVGVSAIQGARMAGASAILAVDKVDAKLDQAKHFGATHACTPEALDQMKAEITGGEGFDYALECIGHAQTIRSTFDAARRGGTAVVVGVGRLDDMVQFSAMELFFNAKTLRGSMYGSSQVRTFMPKLIDFWKAGMLDLEGMISRRITLDEVNDAFRAMQEGEVIRSVIDFK